MKKKNEWLKEHRGVSFEQVAILIEQDRAIDVFDHPNQDKYPGQRIAVVVVDSYALLVPYEKEGDEITLKTIIPSRKATRKYVGDAHYENPDP